MLISLVIYITLIASKEKGVQGATHIRSLEQHALDTNAGKKVLSCHRCLINTGVEKLNYIKI
jgi:hypothetical protein